MYFTLIPSNLSPKRECGSKSLPSFSRPSARTTIEKNKQTNVKFKDIAEMCADFGKKLAATESQLSAVVRSRLDGVKRARDRGVSGSILRGEWVGVRPGYGLLWLS